MKEKLKLLKLMDVRIKLALILIFVAFYLLAIPYPEKSRAFPQLVSLASLIIVIVSLIFDFTKKEIVEGEITDIDDMEIKVLDAETKGLRKKRFYRAWAVIAVSVAAGFLGGFLFSVFFFFLGFTLFSDDRKNLKKNIVIALIMTAFIWFAFEKIMGVPLLEGILW